MSRMRSRFISLSFTYTCVPLPCARLWANCSQESALTFVLTVKTAVRNKQKGISSITWPHIVRDGHILTDEMRWFDSERRSVTYNVSAQKQILFFASSKRIMPSLAHATTYGTTIPQSKNVSDGPNLIVSVPPSQRTKASQTRFESLQP